MLPSVRTTVHKFHGLGNEFLVILGETPRSGIDWAAAARRLCAAATGPGADGLIVCEYGTGTEPVGVVRIRMRLHNADGSRAEMSGNGIRCLVHAVHRSSTDEDPPRDHYVVDTDAGERRVEVLWSDGTTMVSSVAMGRALEVGAPQGWATLGCHPDRPVIHLSLGNPHSVVGVDDVAAVDLVSLGALVPGVNLEVVAPGPGVDEVTMRVHERGVGITSACGTGACAVAVAARRWGLVSASAGEVTVHMVGGDVTVRVADADEVTLVGPSVHIGDHEVDL